MGTLTVFAAAQRALVLVTLIWLLERFVVPLIVAMAFPETAAVGHVAAVADVTTED